MSMKTVPLANGEGTIPLRTSKNPVLGVFRHHCGEIASVHQPKGRKSGTRYLICDRCGTDQCGGTEYQSEIKAKTYLTIEALQAAENAVYTVNEGDEIHSDDLTENQAESLTENQVSDKPIETSINAVSTANQESEIIDAVLTDEQTDKSLASEPLEKPVQTKSQAVQTINSVQSAVEPSLNKQTPASNDDAKPMRIGIAAIIGGTIGALLAAVA